MTKPIIGITTNVRANPAHEDINWSYAPSGFVEGVQKAGGLAILLPVSDPSEAKTYISMIDNNNVPGCFPARSKALPPPDHGAVTQSP